MSDSNLECCVLRKTRNTESLKITSCSILGVGVSGGVGGATGAGVGGAAAAVGGGAAAAAGGGGGSGCGAYI